MKRCNGAWLDAAEIRIGVYISRGVVSGLMAGRDSSSGVSLPGVVGGRKSGKEERVWLPFNKDHERTPKYAPVGFSSQMYAFTRYMNRNRGAYLERSICMHQFVSGKYETAQFERHTAKETRKVFGHMRVLYGVDFLNAFIARRSGGRKPIVDILMNVETIEKLLFGHMVEHKTTYASNAAAVREAIVNELRIKYTQRSANSEEEKVDDVINDHVLRTITARSVDLTGCNIKHQRIHDSFGVSSVVELLITKITSATDAEFLTFLSQFKTECIIHEKQGINASLLSISQIRAVYEKLCNHIHEHNINSEVAEEVKAYHNNMKRGISSGAASSGSSSGGGGSEAGDNVENGTSDAENGVSERPVYPFKKSGSEVRPTTTPPPLKRNGTDVNRIDPADVGDGEGAKSCFLGTSLFQMTDSTPKIEEGDTVTDEFNTEYLSDLQNARKCLALFFWDIVVERMEILWSNVFTFFAIAMTGDETKARELTADFMETAIPMCLSPLFASSSDVLAPASFAHNHADPRLANLAVKKNSIVAHYINVRHSGLSALITFFDRCKPSKFESVLLSASAPSGGEVSFSQLAMIRRSVSNFVLDFLSSSTHKKQHLSYANSEPFPVSRAMGVIKTVAESGSKIEDEPSRDPSLMGSSLFETHNEMRTLLRRVVFPRSISTSNIYYVTRKLLTAVYGDDIVFYTLFFASKSTANQALLKTNPADYAKAFFAARHIPLKVLFEGNATHMNGFARNVYSTVKGGEIKFETLAVAGKNFVFELKTKRAITANQTSLGKIMDASRAHVARPASAGTVSGNHSTKHKEGRKNGKGFVTNNDGQVVLKMSSKKKKPATRKMGKAN
jgi:hypothetical protein